MDNPISPLPFPLALPGTIREYGAIRMCAWQMVILAPCALLVFLLWICLVVVELFDTNFPLSAVFIRLHCTMADLRTKSPQNLIFPCSSPPDWYYGQFDQKAIDTAFKMLEKMPRYAECSALRARTGHCPYCICESIFWQIA